MENYILRVFFAHLRIIILNQLVNFHLTLAATVRLARNQPTTLQPQAVRTDRHPTYSESINQNHKPGSSRYGQTDSDFTQINRLAPLQRDEKTMGSGFGLAHLRRIQSPHQNDTLKTVLI